MKNLGEKIWRLREERGLSQEALAEQLQVSRQTVSNWENDRATPDAYKLKQLCEILCVSADGLLETETPAPISQNMSQNILQNISQEENHPALQKREKGRMGKIILLAFLGGIAAFLLAVAVVLFTLPEQDKSQVITSAFTLTPTMGGIFLLVLSAALLVSVAILLLKFSKRK